MLCVQINAHHTLTQKRNSKNSSNLDGHDLSALRKIHLCGDNGKPCDFKFDKFMFKLVKCLKISTLKCSSLNLYYFHKKV